MSSEQPPATGAVEIKNGIFNLTISLYQHLVTEEQFDPSEARNAVADYLAQIARSLRAFDDEETKQGDETQ